MWKKPVIKCGSLGCLLKLKIFFELSCTCFLNPVCKTDFKFDNERSNVHKIESGAPQEGVLTPTLYAIFTSDISTAGKILTAMHAGNTAILFHFFFNFHKFEKRIF